MRERFSISIDEDSIKAISSLSAKTGLTKSFITGKWITDGLKRDLRLTTSERHFFARKQIVETIESLYTVVGYTAHTKDIKNNMILLYTIPSSFFSSEKEYDMMRLSLLQVMEKIHTFDTELFKTISNSIKDSNLNVSKTSEISDYINTSETSETSEDFKKYETDGIGTV